MTTDLASYYSARAAEYESVYSKTERQHDLAILRQRVREYFRAHRVLEVACGTGYWTAEIASVAASIVATDVSVDVLRVARAKPWVPHANVSFMVLDAFSLGCSTGSFDAGFAGFWWSHVPRERIGAFLTSFHQALAPHSKILLVDNTFVEGSSTPVSRVDAAGNSFQQRSLSDGSTYEVIKNFPDETELRAQLVSHGAIDVSIVHLQYYWLATYRTAAG